MHFNSTSKLLGLEGCFVKRIKHGESSIRITISTKPKFSVCPTCGKETSKVHDYRNQEIKDLPFMHKKAVIVLRKRRYACTCGKRFYERYHFLPRTIG